MLGAFVVWLQRTKMRFRTEALWRPRKERDKECSRNVLILNESFRGWYHGNDVHYRIAIETMLIKVCDRQRLRPQCALSRFITRGNTESCLLNILQALHYCTYATVEWSAMKFDYIKWSTPFMKQISMILTQQSSWKACAWLFILRTVYVKVSSCCTIIVDGHIILRCPITRTGETRFPWVLCSLRYDYTTMN